MILRTFLYLLGAALWLTGSPAATATADSPLVSDSPAALDVSAHSAETDCVILLHGLARTSSSMADMARALRREGYRVVNLDYPSRHYTIEVLTEKAIVPALARCHEPPTGTPDRIHVVTHSLGGILVRRYLEMHRIDRLGRVVMLAPPNQGSEVVDALRDVPGYRALNGPAGMQLGTDSASVPRRLGPVRADTAVIAGTRSINLILSTWLPNPDDGKVSVASTRVDNMCAFLAMPVSHPFIMQDDDVIAEVISYLGTGRLLSRNAEYPTCTLASGTGQSIPADGAI